MLFELPAVDNNVATKKPFVIIGKWALIKLQYGISSFYLVLSSFIAKLAAI